MSERLLDFDPNTGMKTWHSYDESDDRTILRYEQDCQPILDRNKEMQNHGPSGPMGDMCHVASIPSSIQLKWLVEHGVDIGNKDHMPGVKRLLNSNEYRYLKVRHIML
jgi:hypothetical protein